MARPGDEFNPRNPRFQTPAARAVRSLNEDVFLSDPARLEKIYMIYRDCADQRDDCVKCAMTRVNDPEHGLVHPRPFHCNAQLEKYFSCVERVAGPEFFQQLHDSVLPMPNYAAVQKNK